MPLLGLFSLVYAEAASELLQETRISFSRRRPDERLSRLNRWRQELIDELHALRREYQPSLRVEKSLPG
ncbi:MAG: hypothetical protein ACRD21_02585 [Vicinamibacteria bacterium]